MRRRSTSSGDNGKKKGGGRGSLGKGRASPSAGIEMGPMKRLRRGTTGNPVSRYWPIPYLMGHLSAREVGYLDPSDFWHLLQPETERAERSLRVNRVGLGSNRPRTSMKTSSSALIR